MTVFTELGQDGAHAGTRRRLAVLCAGREAEGAEPSLTATVDFE